MLDHLIGAVETEFFRNSCLVIALLVAVMSIVSNQRTARKKQTADFLFAMRDNSDLFAAFKCVREHHDKPDSNIRAIAQNGESEEAKHFRNALNFFEGISIGIQNDIYDEKMLKEAICSTALQVYKFGLPYMDAVREKQKRNTIFQEYRWLAERWNKSKLKSKRSD